MGVLIDGALLTWEETKKVSNHVRQHGVEQFINLYRRCKHRDGDVFKWGDEVCIHVFFLKINKQKFISF